MSTEQLIPGQHRSWPQRRAWRNGFLIALLHSLLWLLLSGNDGWLFGLAFISLATALSIRLGVDLTVFRPRYFPGLFLLYLRELLAAGIQVARIACHPKLPVNPRWVSLDLTSRATRTQMVLAAVMCVLPGTLAARVSGNRIDIHLLDAHQPWRETVEKLEVRLMALLGETTP